MNSSKTQLRTSNGHGKSQAVVVTGDPGACLRVGSTLITYRKKNMARKVSISFSKEYVLEIVVAELRKRHNIPEDLITTFNDYGRGDFITFAELKIEEQADTEE